MKHSVLCEHVMCIYFKSLNLARKGCKTYILHYLIRNYQINLLSKIQYILPHIIIPH